jgi:hypothetical protein
VQSRLEFRVIYFAAGDSYAGFTPGWKETIKAPQNKPSWMPEEINKPFVKKEKIEMIE